MGVLAQRSHVNEICQTDIAVTFIRERKDIRLGIGGAGNVIIKTKCLFWQFFKRKPSLMKGRKPAGLVHCRHKEKCVHTGGAKHAGNR